MNWRRGFWRLWIVLAALWLVPWTIAGVDRSYRYFVEDEDIRIYQDCGPDSRLPPNLTAAAVENAARHTFAQTRWPETTICPHKKPTIERYIEIYVAKYNEKRSASLRGIEEEFKFGAAIAIGIPLAFLMLGTAFGWALGGFKGDSSKA